MEIGRRGLTTPSERNSRCSEYHCPQQRVEASVNSRYDSSGVQGQQVRIEARIDAPSKTSYFLRLDRTALV